MTETDRTDRVVTPYEGAAARAWDDAAPIAAPLCVHETRVRPEWLDYNGHMSESCYLLVFGDDSDAFFRYIGIDEAYRAAGHSLYTVETHIFNRREAAADDPLRLTLHLLDHDPKRLHVFHAMHNAETGALLATAEQMLLHVATGSGRTAPMPEPLQRRLAAIRAAHAALSVPDEVGHVIGIPRRAS
ncbi:acyl-CoA thioesterase FadM [Murinocardiopsis flavida]|uniref:Acyl-CoA thioesterase FadM n=1 Tax=Murinocardiopsis flavida TaxID=645275 RepID=A0A2P8CXB5_9ACTN|nr:thioesterase family protein [Murinocardiopsis flavida]PSK89623.1 acyl-CoA thioesterase FadM [Murinocardiopsis flavida]